MERLNLYFSRLGIYRNVHAGWVTGVCAGIADRLHIKPLWVRIVFAGIAIVSRFAMAIIVYLALAFLMKSREGAASGVQLAYRDLAETVTVQGSPGQLSGLKARFSALDMRLNNLEAAVMTDELSLRRKFRDIGG